jgi:hypothetical protein
MTKKDITKAAGYLMATVAVLHGIRAIMGWEILIDGWVLPVWASAIAFVVVGYLGLRLLKSGK